MFRFKVDESNAITTVTLSGLMTMREFPAYEMEYRLLLGGARQCGWPVRILIDRRNCAPLAAELEAQIEALHRETLTSTRDRLAIVTRALPDGSARHHPATSARPEYFPNAADARHWLLTFDNNPWRNQAA